MTTKAIIPKNSAAAEEFCRKLSPTGKQFNIKDGDVRSLFLRVMASGKKKWILRYNVKVGKVWKDKLFTIANFKEGKNDIEGLTVTAARKEAVRLKTDIKFHGVDPLEEKSQHALQREIQSNVHTVNDLFIEWFNEDRARSYYPKLQLSY